MVWTPDYYIRLVELPPTVDGVVTPNDDGSFDVYINALHCPDRQMEALRHEAEHILRDHLYGDRPVAECEREAGQKAG